MPSVFSHSAVVAGPLAAVPGSLIAPGRTATGTVDDSGAEVTGPVTVAAAPVATATAVMTAARVNLVLCLQVP